jgi:hypothetical protein
MITNLPLLSDMFLLSYKSDFMQRLKKKPEKKIALSRSVI